MEVALIPFNFSNNKRSKSFLEVVEETPHDSHKHNKSKNSQCSSKAINLSRSDNNKSGKL